MPEMIHVILRNGDADDAIAALESENIDCEYLDDYRILVKDCKEAYSVLDEENIRWDCA